MIHTNGSLDHETEAMLVDLLRSIYGSEVKIHQITFVNQHHDYAALLVDLIHPSMRLAIKLAGKEAPYAYPFDRTAYWHQIVRKQTSIPMPEIIAMDVTYQTYPWRYLIKTFIPGEVWADVREKLQGDDLQGAYDQIGQAVGELHHVTFEHFGDVDPDDSKLQHKNFYMTLVERVVASIGNKTIQHDFLDQLEAKQNLFSNVTQPRLCHEDLHPYNILFRQSAGEWQLATILDFDKAWAGHHEIDLAKVELWTGMTGDGFWERYTQIMSVDDGYRLRRPLYQLWWCLEYAANTPKHLADTRQLCNLLGFPPIEQFE